MKKIISFIIICATLFSLTFKATANNEPTNSEQYHYPAYAGAVFAGFVDDDNSANGIAFFSSSNESVRDYLYKKILDVETNKTNYNSHSYVIKDTEGNVVEQVTDNFARIPLSDYAVSPKELNTIMNCLVNESGELLIKPLYLSSYNKETGIVANVYISYAYDIDTIEDKRAEIQNAAQEFINSLGDYNSLSEQERVLLAHDFIANKAYYAPNDINNPIYHTLYSSLVDGVTVCQGYTQAMCYILPKIGVECVSCLNSKENHVWNCVKVDGKWYFVDLTWDDVRITYSNTNYTFDTIKYEHFMIGSDTLLAKHKKDNSDISEFEFSSEKLTWTDVINNGCENEFVYYYIHYLQMIYSQNGDSIYIAPSGFKYENGSLLYTVKMLEAGTLFPEKYNFIFGNLKALDYAVSIPVINYRGSYEFMTIPMKNDVDISKTAKLYMSGIDSNNNNIIEQLSLVTRIDSENNVYGFVCVTDSSQIAAINNSTNTKFFFWDNNMRPYTQPTYKTIKQD